MGNQSYYDPERVEEIRQGISKAKGRFGSVTEHVPSDIHPETFGKGDAASGLHGSVSNFMGTISGEYGHAEGLLDSVDRALDAHRQTNENFEQGRAHTFQPKNI